MLRIGLILLLACASAQAMAQNGRNLAASIGACQETELVARGEVPSAPAATPRASAARSKYAKPAAAPGSGGGDDEALPRLRGSKWHSFLPGMFR